MTYFAQDGAMHGWNGRDGYVPPAPITRVLCDACAESEVPFETVRIFSDGTPHRRQLRPWKWAPRYGGPCHACGKDC
jgi:hypothetical protein